MTPDYLTEFIVFYRPALVMRSSFQDLLQTSSSATNTYGQRVFFFQFLPRSLEPYGHISILRLLISSKTILNVTCLK
ncbi:hypothetical protein HOLleu_19785 [Holothuria leucospilota]|uniref:Uncharacterized protein n=1 Tax=Holothuria leucospilota TaxID=206669 RepID=A0A9Q1C035_HOLLE|nr:hypothetical protein HOLleu_19785 [Holothuria leucospilota]